MTNGLRRIDTDELFDQLDRLSNGTEIGSEADRLAHTLEELRSESVPDLDDAQVDELVACAVASYPRIPRRRWPVWAAVAAAVCGIAVGSVVLTSRHSQKPSPVIRSVMAQVYAGDGREPFLTLSEGSVVRATNDRRLRIVLGQASVITLHPGARVAIRRNRATEATVQLLEGEAMVEKERDGETSTLRIQTTAGTVQSTAADFWVKVSGYHTRVAVQHGKTWFYSPEDAKQVVSSGHVLEATLGQPPLVSALNASDPQTPTPVNKRILSSAPVSNGAASNSRNARNRKTVLATDISSNKTNDTSHNDASLIDTSALKRNNDCTDDACVGSRDAKSAKVLYGAAEAALHSGHFDEAVDHLWRLIAVFPDHRFATTALFDIGRIRETELNDPTGAASAYQQYIDLGPQAPLRPEALRALRRIRATEQVNAEQANTEQANAGQIQR